MDQRHVHRAGIGLLLSSVLAISGCASLKPDPLTPAQIAQVSRADRAKAYEGVEPLNGTLTLEAAIARAIKYNLGQRTRQLEETLARNQLEAGQYDMLPKLMASAGYRDRNNDLITRSVDSVTGQPSLANPYISSERSAVTTDLSFTWSLLDFGQSYYASKQAADRALIASENRRRALHNLVQDVRTAFWRTAGAQKLQGEVRSALAAAEDALGDSRKAEAERLRSPLDSLRYQRQLLDNLRLLEAIEQELSTSRVELAALIDLPLGQALVVAEPADQAASWRDMPVEKMEEQAVASNAELRTSFYNARIASQEARRSLLKNFPGLSFSYGARHSNDDYLIHQRWNEASLQLSFNLMGLVSLPAQMRAADAGTALAEQQRVATQMALLAQVHVARLQYLGALRQFERADSIYKVDSDISQQIARREDAQTLTKLDRVAQQTTTILSLLRRYQTLAQVHAAAGKLQATLGLEPVVAQPRNVSLTELTGIVAAAMRQWDDTPKQVAATREQP
ncbi:MAG: TolC family protein [Rubrivivax sp.]|nr:MAG: TolC family protein [Rubrivivax sp.]